MTLACSGANACVTTYGDGACFSLRVSKEVIPTQELLEQLLNKYLHEELDVLYTKVCHSHSDSGLEIRHGFLVPCNDLNLQ